MSDPDPSRPATRTRPLGRRARGGGGRRRRGSDRLRPADGALPGRLLRPRLAPARESRPRGGCDPGRVHPCLRPPGLVPGRRVRSWLLRITANASYDILRRAQRRPTTALPNPDEGEPDIPDKLAVNPVAESARSELYRAWTLRCASCPRTSGPRSCCVTSTGWTTRGLARDPGPGRDREVTHPPRAPAPAGPAGRPAGTVRRVRASDR